MHQRTSHFILIAVAFFALGNDDCDSGSSPPSDPFDDADLRVSQQLDLGRLHGEVVNKRLGNFVMDHPAADAKAGRPYYCLDIRTFDTNKQATDTAYCGVRQVVYDSVAIGTRLPIDRTYNVYEIAQLHGRIVDRRAAPEEPAWYVVVDHVTEVKVYRVDPQSYYRFLELGQVLPFNPPSDMARRASDAPAEPAPEAGASNAVP
jgi:hypothetical protein